MAEKVQDRWLLRLILLVIVGASDGIFLLLQGPGLVHTACQRRQFSEIRLLESGSLKFGRTGGFGRYDLESIG